MKPGLVLLLLLFIVIAILALNRCKLSCPGSGSEGMRRLAAKNTLEASAYGYSSFPGYSLKEKPRFDIGGHVPQIEGMSFDKASTSRQCKVSCAGYEPGSPQEGECLKACDKFDPFLSSAAALLGIGKGDKPCSSSQHCAEGELCIMAGPYTGSDTGYCMHELESDLQRPDVYPNRPGGALYNVLIKDGQEDYSLKDMKADLKRAYSKAASAVNKKRENFSLPFGQMTHWQEHSCPPGQYWNAGVGECQGIFQGSASAQGVWTQRDVFPRPVIAIPGTTLPSYGTGTTVPFDYLPQQLTRL